MVLLNQTGAETVPKKVSPDMLTDAWLYALDSWQRGVLFLDTLRQSATNMIAHEREGMPPLLDFSYETCLDARTFDPPANYALLKVTEAAGHCLDDCLDPDKPPVIIVDPRAGHGPGIGGFKQDSEVGIALHEGYPVYFVVFFPDPEPHQTIADVLQALRRFIDEATRMHGGKTPILYGNCQAGWLLTMLAADCESFAGPVVTNGSPLSYWASSDEGNPMQTLGSLVSGVWIVRWLSDLGNGTFDGAWLVQNFENLNPANALWDKYYQLYAHVDTERERFLTFERWWSGFYRLSEEEITETVEDLFIGNKFERGEIQLHDCCRLDLKRIKGPLLIFASEGDNITPPRQALHWIRQIYPTTAALKAAGQRIAYLINPHVGHLGIFVSAKVARLEHRAILEHVEKLRTLEPGLYEMKIDNPTGDPDCRHDQYQVRFEARQLEDLCESSPALPFERVRRDSETADRVYRTVWQPWVQLFTNPVNADVLCALHPMRVRRTLLSELHNPWLWALPLLVRWVEEHRCEQRDTEFHRWERTIAGQVDSTIMHFTEWRDAAAKRWFDFLFNVREPGAALRDISESVMREVIGDRTVDEMLTIGQQDIEASAQSKL